ncbi:hypothetical protein [Deinococcus sp.]|uniref:hypothetical protein n=1 Tax=Deinococcus sp. TaxID=47478 RepID=UPI003CC57BDB
MAQKRKNFALRLAPELHTALERWASDDLRSVNAQIEYLLTEAAKRAGRLHQRPGQPPEAQPPQPQPPELPEADTPDA